ncbi:hypothetical protein DMI62_11475 [Escherichia coli]|nr:hypothetical protein [Escherichia coli]
MGIPVVNILSGYFATRDECSVSDLANYFSVTKETIRTDLKRGCKSVV